MKKIVSTLVLLSILLNICLTAVYAVDDVETLEKETNSIKEEKPIVENGIKEENETQKEDIVKEENITESIDVEENKNSEEKEEINEIIEQPIEEKVQTETKKEETKTIEKIETEKETKEIEEEQDATIKYKTHVQNAGWQAWKTDGELAGTEGKGLRLEAIKIEIDKKLGINTKYQVHVQNIGWQAWKQNGELAGTEGKGLRLEAIKIKLDLNNEYEIKYRVHVQNIGWQAWKQNGELAGTEGKGLRLEAIEIMLIKKTPKTKMYIDTQNNIQVNKPRSIKIKGWKMSNLLNTKVQVFIDNNDKRIDSANISYKKRNDVIEKITGYGTEEENPLPGFIAKVPTENLTEGKHTAYIKIYEKDTELISQQITFEVIKVMSIEYSSHLQNIGWQEYVDNGETTGDTNDSLRLEAFKINLYNSDLDGTIEYSAHVQDIGWKKYVKNNEIAGTTGAGKRVEAVKIKLTGELAEKYDIYYKTYVENYGWLGWTKNGEMAGTEGLSFRLEAMQIKLTPKGTKIDSSESAFVKKPKFSYTSHVGLMGWQKYVGEGSVTGTIGYSLRIEALKTKLENTSLSGTVQCSAHVENKGWMNFVNSGQIAGTTGAGRRVEAVKIKLTEELEKYFDIYYRTHIENLGWIAWAKNGEPAGSQGYAYRMEAMQIWIVPKGADAPGRTSGHFYNKALERKSIEGVKLVLGNVCAGIDVSIHNGDINWKELKGQTDFAIIRCGYGQNFENQDDKIFEKNIEGCIANNIPVEVYLYSYADTTTKASSEADHVIRLCNKYKQFIRKIWYDVEDDSVFNQIGNNLSKESLGEIVDTFANKLKNQGYNVGLYTYISALNKFFPGRIRNDYELWIAHYSGESQDEFERLYNKYKLLFNMWQFTSKGTISGINGDVDMSIRY